MTKEFEVDKIARKKNEELEKAMKATTNQDIIDMVNRVSAMEFEQENPVKPKIKKNQNQIKKLLIWEEQVKVILMLELWIVTGKLY